MTTGIDDAALREALRTSRAHLEDGLSEVELASVESRFGFTFADDHRRMLSLALPLDDQGRWPDWRDGAEDALWQRVRWPVEGILFDVEHAGFWMSDWGQRPSRLPVALTVARSVLDSVPPLAPLHGHRYVPTRPTTSGNPVLSCYQTDVIYYGRDLLDWFRHEFLGEASPVVGPVTQLPFWQRLLDLDG